mmetsp:Transcript_29004/g.70046  ORF Transcript_29004/g.70046 Transcript_29004/m.70046 type:complete len:106 (-) Transcript_29004:2174-2491(-)
MYLSYQNFFVQRITMCDCQFPCQRKQNERIVPTTFFKDCFSFQDYLAQGFTSSSAKRTSSMVIKRPSTPFPSRRALDRAKEPAHRTNPAISAPENPPVAESAAKS